MAILIRKNLDYSTLDLGELGLEIIGINLKIENTDLSILTYYNPPNKSLSKEIFNKLGNKNFILLGDLNAKSPVLGCVSTNENGLILEDILIDNNIICLNNKKPTYTNFSSLESDILDIALASSSTFKYFKSFQVLDNYDMGSDHYPIKIDLSLSSNQYNITRTKISTDWDVYKANLPKTIPTNLYNDINALNNFVIDSIKNAIALATTIKPTSKKQKIPSYLTTSQYF